jgi:hypothetical protein
MANEYDIEEFARQAGVTLEGAQAPEEQPGVTPPTPPTEQPADIESYAQQAGVSLEGRAGPPKMPEGLGLPQVGAEAPREPVTEAVTSSLPVSMARHAAAGVMDVAGMATVPIRATYAGMGKLMDRLGMEEVGGELRRMEAATKLYEKKFEGVTEAIRGEGSQVFSKIGERMEAGAYSSFSDYAKDIAATIKDNPLETLRWMAETGARSAPQMFTAMSAGKAGAARALTYADKIGATGKKAKALATLGGTMASGATMAPMEMTSAQKEWEREGKGNYGLAALYGVGSGIIEGFTETGLAVRTLMRAGKGQAAKEMADTAIKTWGGVLKQAAKSGLSEGLEEDAQQILQNALGLVAADHEDPVEALDLLKGTIESFLGGIGPGAVMGGAVARREMKTELEKKVDETRPPKPPGTGPAITAEEVERATEAEIKEGTDRIIEVAPGIAEPKPGATDITGKGTTGAKDDIVVGGVSMTTGEVVDEDAAKAQGMSQEQIDDIKATPDEAVSEIEDLPAKEGAAISEAVGELVSPAPTAEEQAIAAEQEAAIVEQEQEAVKTQQEAEKKQLDLDLKMQADESAAVAQERKSQAKIAETEAKTRAKRLELGLPAPTEAAPEAPPAAPAAAPAAPAPEAGVTPAADIEAVAREAGVTVEPVVEEPVAEEPVAVKPAAERVKEFGTTAEMIKGMTKPALVEAAGELGIPVKKKDTKATIAEAISQGVTEKPAVEKPKELPKPKKAKKKEALPPAEPKETVKKRKALEKSLQTAEDLEAGNIDRKSTGVKLAQRLEKQGWIGKIGMQEINEIAKDRDKTAEDLGVALRPHIEEAIEALRTEAAPKTLKGAPVSEKGIVQPISAPKEKGVEMTQAEKLRAIDKAPTIQRAEKMRVSIQKKLDKATGAERIDLEEQLERLNARAAELGAKVEEGPVGFQEARRRAFDRGVARDERAKEVGKADNLERIKASLRKRVKDRYKLGDTRTSGKTLERKLKEIESIRLHEDYEPTRHDQVGIEMARELGKTIVWLKPNKFAGGFFSAQDPNTIYVSTKSRFANTQVILHEIKHSLDYEGKSDAEVNAIIERFHAEVRRAAGVKSDHYKAWLKQYSKDVGYIPDNAEAWEEYTAEIWQDAALTPEFYEKLSAKAPTFFNAVIGGYRKIVRALFKNKYLRDIAGTILDMQTVATFTSAKSEGFVTPVDTAMVYDAIATAINEYTALKKGRVETRMMDAAKQIVSETNKLRKEIPSTRAEFDKRHRYALQEGVHPDVLKPEIPVLRFSRGTLDNWRVQFRKRATVEGWGERQIARAIKDAEHMAQVMAKDEHVIPDETVKGKDGSPVVSNSFETPLKKSIDFSGVCVKSAKEQAYLAEIQKELARRGESPHMGRVEVLALNQFMKDNGLKSSCRTCYVLQKVRDRSEMGRVFFDWSKADFEAKAEEQGYPSTFLVGMGKKRDQGSIDDRDSLMALLDNAGYKKREIELAFSQNNLEFIGQDPRLGELYKLYNTYLSGAKASKVHPHLFRAYNGQILKWNKDQIAKANVSRGLRISGFTDVEGFSMLDLAQVISDASVMGLHVYQYTKVPEVASFLANSGVKMNISMFLQTREDGTVDWDEVDGMPVADMRRVVAENPNDIGAMVVANDDAQIQWALDNPEVGLVIPNHVGTTEKDMFGKVGIYDYTNVGGFKTMPVKETVLVKRGKDKGKYVEKVKTKGKSADTEVYAKHGKKVYFKYWLERNKYDGKKSADAMMRYFNKDGILLPFQEQLGEHPNYYKVLTDFAAIGKRQGVVKPRFNMGAFEGLWSSYVKQGGVTSRTYVDDKLAKKVAADFIAQRTEKGTKLTIEEAVKPALQAGERAAVPRDAGFAKAAGKTARPWKSTVTYNAAQKIIKMGDRVLDYGSGPFQKVAPKVKDIGATYVPFDRYAPEGMIGKMTDLSGNDVVMGSNVLNTAVKAGELLQGEAAASAIEGAYYGALNEMTGALKPTGKLVVNMPTSGPRADWMSPARLRKDLETRFGKVEKVGPEVFVASQPLQPERLAAGGRTVTRKSQQEYAARMKKAGQGEPEVIQNLFDRWAKLRGTVETAKEARFVDFMGRTIGGKDVDHRDIMGDQPRVHRAVNNGYVRMRHDGASFVIQVGGQPVPEQFSVMRRMANESGVPVMIEAYEDMNDPGSASIFFGEDAINELSAHYRAAQAPREGVSSVRDFRKQMEKDEALKGKKRTRFQAAKRKAVRKGPEPTWDSQEKALKKMQKEGVTPEEMVKRQFDTWHAYHGEVTKAEETKIISPDGRAIGGHPTVDHREIMGSQRAVNIAIALGYVKVRADANINESSYGGFELGKAPSEKQENHIKRLFSDYKGYLSAAVYKNKEDSFELGDKDQGLFEAVFGDAKYTFEKMMSDVWGFFSNRPKRVLSPLQEMRMRMQATERAATARERSGENWAMRDSTWFTTVIRDYQNRHIDTKDAMWAIEATFGPVPTDLDIDKNQKVYISMAKDEMENAFYNEWRPILEKIQDAGLTMEEAGEFLMYRRVPEYNALIAQRNPELDGPGSGIEDSEANAYMAGLDANKMQDLTDIAEMVDEFRATTHRLMVHYGLETQETIDAWEAEHPSWVSFQREGVDAFNFGSDGGGQGFSVAGTMGKVAIGSALKIDPASAFASLIATRERTIKRGVKNTTAGHATYGAAVKYPNSKFWRAIKPSEANTPDGRAKLVRELSQFGLSETDIANMFDAPKKPVYNSVTKMVEYYTNSNLAGLPNVFTTRVNGENRFVVFNSRDERAMRMVTALKNRDFEPMIDWFKKSAKFTQLYAAMSTQWNPLFGIKNFGRDAIEAMVTLTATPLSGKRRSVAMKLIPSYLALWRFHKARRQLRAEPQGEMYNWIREFKAAGGQTGHIDYFENNKERAADLAKEMNKLAITRGKGKGAKAQVRKVVAKIMGAVEDYNTSMENATRLSTYITARQIGMNKKESAILAKQVTVNFNDKGRKSANANALYAFFNASVQGTATIGRTLTERKADGKLGVSKSGEKVIAGGFLLGVIQAFMLMKMGAGDDNPPQFVRDKSFIIYNPFDPDHPYTIPMPLGFLFLPAMGRRSIELFTRKDESKAKMMVEMAEMIGSAHNPLGEIATGVQIGIPTVAKPVYQLWANEDWKGMPIYREDFNSLKTTPGYTRARDNATSYGQFVSMALDRMTGGDGVLPGLWSPTPDQVDFITSAYFGGVGREAIKTATTATAISNGEWSDLPMYKVPGVGIYMGSMAGKEVDRADFFKSIKKAYDHQAQVKHHSAKGTLGDYYKDNPEAIYANASVRLKYKIDKLGRLRKKMEESGQDTTGIENAQMRLMNMVRFYMNGDQ